MASQDSSPKHVFCIATLIDALSLCSCWASTPPLSSTPAPCFPLVNLLLRHWGIEPTTWLLLATALPIRAATPTKGGLELAILLSQLK